MIRRRQLNHIFNLIKCDTWINIVERNGFAPEKVFVLKDCYLTLEQLSELQSGLLLDKVRKLESVLLTHLHSQKLQARSLSMSVENANSIQNMTAPLTACKSCKLTKYRCEVCNGKNGP